MPNSSEQLNNVVHIITQPDQNIMTGGINIWPIQRSFVLGNSRANVFDTVNNFATLYRNIPLTHVSRVHFTLNQDIGRETIARES